MRIFLSAGEASGDAYAAALVEELRKSGRTLEFEGIGGRRLQEQIGSLIADSSHWGAISIVQSVQVAPRAIAGARHGVRALRRGKPGIFIAIDFGFFNIRMCRAAKKHGWKVLYFMPPSSWRRDRQGRDLAAVTDSIVTPFPWSAELLKRQGCDVHFYGHPLKQLIGGRSPALVARDRIAVLPGSRGHEVERNLELIAKVGASLSGQIEFAIAPNLALDAVLKDWNRLAPDRADVFTQADVYGVLERARAAIVCSGTATLEAALMGCPQVIVYQVTKAMAREAKLIGFKMPKFIGLPNIVLDRLLVPELAGLEIDPATVRAALEPLLSDSPEREQQLRGYEEVASVLGPGDAITKTATLVLQMAS